MKKSTYEKQKQKVVVTTCSDEELAELENQAIEVPQGPEHVVSVPSVFGVKSIEENRAENKELNFDIYEQDDTNSEVDNNDNVRFVDDMEIFGVNSDLIARRRTEEDIDKISLTNTMIDDSANYGGEYPDLSKVKNWGPEREK